MRISRADSLAGATILGVAGLIFFNWPSNNQRRTGEYQNFTVEAFYGGAIRRIIMYPQENRSQRLIATDLPGGENFEVMEFMFTPDDSPLRKYTSRDIQEAWEKAWK